MAKSFKFPYILIHRCRSSSNKGDLMRKKIYFFRKLIYSRSWTKIKFNGNRKTQTHTHLVNRTEWQIPFNRYDDINDGHVRVNVQQKHTFEAHADLEQTNVERKQIKLLLYMKYLFRSQLHSCATKRIYQENRKSVLRSCLFYIIRKLSRKSKQLREKNRTWITIISYEEMLLLLVNLFGVVLWCPLQNHHRDEASALSGKMHVIIILFGWLVSCRNESVHAIYENVFLTEMINFN